MTAAQWFDAATVIDEVECTPEEAAAFGKRTKKSDEEAAAFGKRTKKSDDQ